MSTGTIVTPCWENIHMNNKLQFNPILTELDSADAVRFPLEQNLRSSSRPVQEILPNNRVYFRRRLFAGLALVLVGALFWTVISLVVGVGEKQVGADLTSNAPREIYIVAPGDTLWSIASAIDNDGDPRDTIDRLAALNGGSSLYIGQRLILSS